MQRLPPVGIGISAVVGSVAIGAQSTGSAAVAVLIVDRADPPTES